VLVSYPLAGRSVLASYNLDSLRPDWHTDVDQANYGVLQCGSRICLINVSTVLAIEPASGRLVWRMDSTGFSGPLGEGYVLVAPPVLDDIRLIDADTGRTALNVGPWTAGVSRSGPTLFFHFEPVLGVPSASRTWIAVLSLDPIGLRVLGAVSHADPDGCESTAKYLACRTVNDAVQVWRLAGPR
jgi:hypothetical protein